MEYLDCTLRDGGYYTNWDFSKEDVQLYMQAMEKLPIDIIEVGYRSKQADSYEGKYFYCPDFVLNELHSWAPSKKLAIMLNEKDTNIADLNLLLDPCIGIVKVVRIAVAPNRFDKGLELAKAIKQKGFEVAFNLMYMSSLTDHLDVLEKVGSLNNIVDYFSLVDSYGSVYPEDVARIISQCKTKTSAKIGFHGHNNIELAFANSLAAINAGAVVIDGTICGMGRGAGNLKTELFLTHMASKNNLIVDFDALSSVVSQWEKLQKKYEWGTNLPYMVSGANSLPQKDVMDWVSTRFYSINSIIRGLNNQSVGIKDNVKLKEFLPEKNKYRSAVIIGGGASALSHSDAIRKFVHLSEDVCIIHASSKNAKAYDTCKWPQFFCLVGNEGQRLESVFSEFNTFDLVGVLPPYPRKMGTYIPDVIKDKVYELPEVNVVDKYTDSHTALALQVAIQLGVHNVYIAGYDGYANTIVSDKEKELIIENNYIFRMASKKFEIFEAVTPTKYEIKNIRSIYSFIS